MHDQGKAEIIVYKGIKFRRYPNSPSWADRVYYVPNASHRKRGTGRLHQEIWKDANGPIPAGYEIHHKDHNPLNNALDNLELITVADHRAHHDKGYTEEELRILRLRLEHARVSASNWHKSEEGREWHRELAHLANEARYLVTITCQQCGKSFEADNITVASGRGKYCSNACKTRARYQSGVDNIQRACAFCGREFTANRYSPQRFCSRTCAIGLRFGKPRPSL